MRPLTPFSAAAATNDCDDRERGGDTRRQSVVVRGGKVAPSPSKCHSASGKKSLHSHTPHGQKKECEILTGSCASFSVSCLDKIPCLLLPPSSKPPLPCPCQEPLSIHLSVSALLSFGPRGLWKTFKFAVCIRSEAYIFAVGVCHALWALKKALSPRIMMAFRFYAF